MTEAKLPVVTGPATIIPFPKRKRRHAAPCVERFASRAAKRTSKSAVTPFARATSVASNADHHSSGTRSRRRHFETIEYVAPMSDTAASMDGHSSITARKEFGVFIESLLGQSGLSGKAKTADDASRGFADYAAMTGGLSETQAKQAFIARVKRARMARFPTQKPICTILGIDQGVYKHYETRTPLPYRFIPKFVAATGVSYEWLLAGEGEGPAMTMPAVPERRRRTARRKVA